MKNLFSHIRLFLLVLGTILMVSCEDRWASQEDHDGKVGLKLALSLPGAGASTRAGGTEATTGSEAGTDYENLIERTDIRLLVFKDGTFAEEITSLKITGTSPNYYLEGMTNNEYEGEIEATVFANVKSRGVEPATNDFAGKDVEAVNKMFCFAYGKEAWTVNQTHRIPMWGSTKLNVTLGQQNTSTVNMYRAVAKVGFTVNKGDGLTNFTLQSVRMYFSNKEGYSAPLPNNIPEAGATEITSPSIPTTSGQIAVSNPLLYSVGGAPCYEDKIYLPEANNKTPGTGQKPVCIVVGGYYSGNGPVEPGKESYYRIDFKDYLENGKDGDLYDLLRNHSYRIDIKKVETPGTPTPEDALENIVVGMTVSIDEWEDVPMRGIPDQYTLATDKSIISINHDQLTDGAVIVTTDYGKLENGNGEWSIVEQDGTWFTATPDADNKTIRITSTQNYGVARRGTFYVRSGNLQKQIVIEQEQPPTANCYVVGEGTHQLIVTIKGNGNKGLVAEGVALDTDASINPARIGIIWETKEGLVTLNGSSIDKTTGTIGYSVNTTDATIGGVPGGNALIGAFDDKNTILWSWHIWVCPNLTDKGLESHDEDWTLNGYKVMDRNLGALSNSPGVASLGLLYQWGRKDPFIGAAQTNDKFTGSGRLETKNYDNYKWGVETTGSKTNIPFTIANPTTLTYDGLSSKEEKIGGYLWGSNEGLNKEIKDLGTKTIYDPCPYGYRVPPVDAFVFSANVKLESSSDWTWKIDEDDKGDIISSSGKNYIFRKSSEKYNWNENLTYIPHFTSNWGKVNNDYFLKNYVGNYIEAKYYGFYLNYGAITTPTLTDKTESGLEHYQKSNNKWDTRARNYQYELATDNKNTTWLPISGAYDPTKGFTFSGVTVEKGSSITINSFLWTNSSVESGTKWIPAAMFLHGTEKKTTSTGSGRHIHGLNKTDIKAEPHYAGAVRCVRDTKKDFSENNSLSETVTIGKAEGSTKGATLKSINDQWRVIDSGAYWLSVSPERGDPDKGKGQTITFKALEANTTGTERKATVLIQFGNEPTPKKIVVTQSK